MRVCKFFQTYLVLMNRFLSLWGVLRPYRKRTVEVIANSLNFAQWKAWVVFLSGLLSFVRHASEYNNLTKSNIDKICDLASQVRIEGKSFLHEAIFSERPVLIVTMHMGDFQLGFLKLVEACSPLKRELSVFKMNAADDREKKLLEAFEMFGVHPHMLRANEEGGRQAFLALRAGHVVAMTIDLEVSVKTRSVVDFLGHPCYMQNGPATIALINRSLILPVINFTKKNGQRVVKVYPSIDTLHVFPALPMAKRVNILTQQLADQLETWIRTWPSQVQAWFAIADTLVEPLPKNNIEH
jgi:lauroyl/myristoyl acyltransferase